MRFTINGKKFLLALEQAVVVAATVDKEVGDEFTTDKLSLGTTKNELFIIALSTTAAIKITLSNDDSYVCHHVGHVTTSATQLARQVASFPLSGNIELATSPQGLIVKDIRDPDTMSLVPIHREPLRLLPVPQRFKRSMTTDRATFLRGLKKVGFAMAREETKNNYMCVMLKATKSSLRFAAGSGARFAVHDVRRAHLTTVTSPLSVLLPKHGITQVVKILGKTESEQLTVKYAEESVADKTVKQILIESGATTVFLYEVDASTKYPDLNSILLYDYPYKVTTKVEDWKLPAAAILGTMTEESDQIYNTRVQADLLHGCFGITTNACTQLKRKVPFALGPFEYDREEKTDAPWFVFNSWYVKEVTSRGSKKGKVTFHFENQEQWSDSNNDRRMKPILLEFPEVHLADGSKEQFQMFFSTSTKW